MRMETAVFLCIYFYKFYAYSTKVVNLSQFSYELLILSYERRLYHHLSTIVDLGVPHFPSLEGTSIME